MSTAVMKMERSRSKSLKDGSEDKDFVRALARGLDVIVAFGREGRPLTLSEAAERSKLSRGSARRFLLTLEHLGYLTSIDGRFSLTWKALRLGYSYLASQTTWQLCQPILSSIVKKTDHTSSVCVLDDNEVVYVARVQAPKIVSGFIGLGTRLPAHATSTGKVLLSGLPEKDLADYFKSSKRPRFTQFTLVTERDIRASLSQVHKTGWAIAEQEIELGLISLAVPIYGENRQIVAAINTSSTVGISDRKTFLDENLPLLRKAASEISELLLTHRSSNADDQSVPKARPSPDTGKSYRSSRK